MKYLTFEEYDTLSPVKKEVYDRRIELEKTRKMLEVIVPGYHGQIPLNNFAPIIKNMSTYPIYSEAQEYARMRMAYDYISQMKGRL